MTDDARQYSPSTARNRDPIWTVLQAVYRRRASCSRWRAARASTPHFPGRGPPVVCQPSDVTDNLASIEAWTAESWLPNVRPDRADAAA